MATIQTVTEMRRREVQGRGFVLPFTTNGVGTLTAAAVNSGVFSNSMNVQIIGTTYPTTLVGLQGPNISVDYQMHTLEISCSTSESIIYGRLYLRGTINIAATGSQLTKDGTWTYLTRGGNKIGLIPYYLITTVTATTAANFTATYQSAVTDTTITGSATNILPNVATAAGGLYNMNLELADSSVFDVSAITVGTAAASGAAALYLFEPSGYANIPYAGATSFHDQIYGGMWSGDQEPATPDAGLVTSMLGFITVTNTVAQTLNGWRRVVDDA